MAQSDWQLLAAMNIDISPKNFNIRTQRRQYEGHNTPLGYYTDQGPKGHGEYNGQGVYCGLSTASEVFLTFTTQLYQYFNVFFLFTLFSDQPEVFLPKYSQTAILHAPRFQRVVISHSPR